MTQGEDLGKLMAEYVEEATGQTITDPSTIIAMSSAITDFLSTEVISVSGDIASKAYVRTISAEASANAYRLSVTHTDTATGLLKVYVDAQDTSVLSSANSHTDNAITTFKTYVDIQDGISIAYTNSASGNLVNYINVQDAKYVPIEGNMTVNGVKTFLNQINYTSSTEYISQEIW